MQIVKVTHADFFNAAVVTPAMVVELAAAVGYSADAIAKLQSVKLAKGNAQVRALPDGKLRTCVLQKLQQPNDLCSGFTNGNSFEFEFAHLQDVAPEPDINSAGQNTAKRSRAATGKGTTLTGAYTVVRKDGLKCTAESDPEKYAMWQHVWNSGTFEQYFANAPKKAVTRTQRIITASSEMLWAVKQGWVKPVSN